MQTGGHILSEFNAALKSFKSKTVNIGCLSQQNLENAIQGMISRNSELCNKVIAEDEDVDQLEISIDEEGMTLMSKYRPFASDLRAIVASMKITNVIERISDHAVSIAKRSRKLNKFPELPETALIEPLYKQANSMLTDALSAYSNSDLELAMKVIEADDALDNLHKQATKKLTKCLEGEGENHKAYLHLVFISRWLERVGDLAENIAEDVIYMETATDIRHGGELPS
ncbi:phosphate signaling complex protein PhoU [Rubritalea marina]|uniref:phosphate signaling complex protein PhoU n=1 Tax=Rubritalea marina TaxID=361055 RepID=UPI0003623ECE|nr:phosphate signaling complex protein PhoU [Rubritalea marina]